MSLISVKRRYYDFRSGGITLAPVLGISNFMMLVYMTINESVPLYIFVPAFAVLVLVSFTIIGRTFRKIQFSTDLNMGFERASKQGRTFFEIMESQRMMLEKLNIPITPEFMAQWKTMKNIAEEKV